MMLGVICIGLSYGLFLCHSRSGSVIANSGGHDTEHEPNSTLTHELLIYYIGEL
jgi:hypothetical protein